MTQNRYRTIRGEFGAGMPIRALAHIATELLEQHTVDRADRTWSRPAEDDDPQTMIAYNHRNGNREVWKIPQELPDGTPIFYGKSKAKCTPFPAADNGRF